MSLPLRADALGLVSCHTCSRICAAQETRCPRCGGALHARKHDAFARGWAFLLAALMFYVPANVLPVMYTATIGGGSGSTILHGVIEFWRGGSWDIALLIFVASVGVPATKFIALGTLLVTTQRRSAWARRQRSRLYRFVELIGYWSMLDVAVVALVCGLVQFRALGTAEPRLGIVFFGLVVILTMLSAMSFDPRLIWDGEKPHD